MKENDAEEVKRDETKELEEGEVRPVPRTDDYISKYVHEVDVGGIGDEIFIDFQVVDIRPQMDDEGSGAGFSAGAVSTATIILEDGAAEDLARGLKKAVEDQLDVTLDSDQEQEENNKTKEDVE